MRRLLVSDRADADLREIWLYSFKTWGEAQADRYLDELDSGLQECAAEPERGTCREDVRIGYWSRLIRRHVAFYTFTDDEVLVQRVLHDSMDQACTYRRTKSEAVLPDDNWERARQRFRFNQLLPRLQARHPELNGEEIVRLVAEDAPATTRRRPASRCG